MIKHASPSTAPDAVFDQFLTVGQASAYPAVHPDTLRNWDRAGKLKPQRHPINGYRLYSIAALERIAAAVASSKRWEGDEYGEQEEKRRPYQS